MLKLSQVPGIEEVLNCFTFPVLLVDRNHRLVIANRAAGAAARSKKGPSIIKDCYQFSDEGLGKFPHCPLNQAI